MSLNIKNEEVHAAVRGVHLGRIHQDDHRSDGLAVGVLERFGAHPDPPVVGVPGVAVDLPAAGHRLRGEPRLPAGTHRYAVEPAEVAG